MRNLQNDKNFNTSHVSIKLSPDRLETDWYVYFNTSHVSIKPGMRLQAAAVMCYFNTSHVSIKLVSLLFLCKN